jgi:hypothetical protein
MVVGTIFNGVAYVRLRANYTIRRNAAANSLYDIHIQEGVTIL